MVTNRHRVRRPTNSLRTHRLSLAVTTLAALVGLTGIVLGVIAWTMDRPEPRQLLDKTSSAVGRSPWFDQGTTIFVAPQEKQTLPTPAALGCTLFTAAGERALSTKSDPDLLGTRVVAQVSLVPIVTVGTTGAGDRITCSGPAMRESVVWLLPTTAGPSRTPLSIVVGGIALCGLAVLIDPRARGLRRGLG